MDASGRADSKSITAILLLAILFLFFFQLLSDLIESTYAFGLLMTGIPIEIASILFLFTPIFLFLLPRRVPRGFVLATGGLALLCRAASLTLDTRGKMIVAGLGVGFFLVFFPAVLWKLARKGDGAAGLRLGAGLALAALTSMLLRAAYSGNDISAFDGYRAIDWALALAAALLLPGWTRSLEPGPETIPPAAAPASGWRAAGLCLGLNALFLLLYFGFISPTVIARWSAGSYPWIGSLAAAAPAVFLALWLGSVRFRAALRPGVLLAWNLLFVAALAFALWSYQVPFPKDSRLYPLSEPTVGPLAGAALGLALFLSPVIFADFTILAHSLISSAPSTPALAGGFLLGSLYLLLMVFAHVFTTVYDYIPVMGPWFRDRFWLVYLTAGAVPMLALLLARRGDYPLQADSGYPRLSPLAPALSLVIIAALWMGVPHPEPPGGAQTLRVMTYNIQQGYSANGQKNLEGQLAVIRAAKPDLIGLEETDIARLSGGNSDFVRLVADRLNLYSYYGPKTVNGTFGIALLSRYPLQDAQTFFMYSTGEQTAAILARILVAGKPFTVLVTHLGNGGPLIQQQQVLERLSGQMHVIAMGDFNFRPYEQQYRLTVQSLQDAWMSAKHQAPTPPGWDPRERIDYIFLSPGTEVLSAQVLPPGPSDHPALVAEIGLQH